MQGQPSTKEVLEKLIEEKAKKENEGEPRMSLKQIMIAHLKLMAFCFFALIKNAGIIFIFMKYGLPVFQSPNKTVEFKETSAFDHLNPVTSTNEDKALERQAFFNTVCYLCGIRAHHDHYGVRLHVLCVKKSLRENSAPRTTYSEEQYCNNEEN